MALQQSLPPAAEAYAAAQRQEIAAALAAASRLWGRMTDDFDGSWSTIRPQVVAVMSTAQRRIIASAQAYVPAVLRETYPAAADRDPDYLLDPEALIGVSGDGLGTDTMADEAIIRTKVRVASGDLPALALESGGSFLTTSVGTMLSDTGRTVEKVNSAGRRVTTFVRMLTPPSCGRCVILAGQTSHTGQAFQRHPRCDCRNIPSAESDAQDLTVNPAEYLDTLSDEGQARLLGSKANAQAYREGADLNQLVNAYRKGGDVRSAQQFGHTIKLTTEGTTRQGVAYRRMSAMRAHQDALVEAGFATRLTRNGPEQRLTHQTKARQPRLMPESIYGIATDASDAQRLLRLYGWIL